MLTGPSSANRKVDRNPGREGACTCLLSFLDAVFIVSDAEKPMCDSEQGEERESRLNMERPGGTSRKQEELGGTSRNQE